MTKNDTDSILRKKPISDILPLIDTEYKRFNEIYKYYKKVREIGKAHSSQLAKVLNDLVKVGIIEKKEEKQEKGKSWTFYRISPRFKELIWPMIIKFTDKLLMDTYPPDQIVSLSKSTFYGLKDGIFMPPVNSKNLTFRYFTPEYIKLSKTGLSINDLFEIKDGIWKGKIREKIGISEALETIMNKLLELKKEHRKKELKINFNKRLKKAKNKSVKSFLKHYSEVLLHIINSTDPDKEFLKKFITVGGHRTISFSNISSEDIDRIREILPKKEKNLSVDQLKEKYKDGILVFNCQGLELWSKNYYYFKDVNNLSSKEKNEVVKFLLKVIKDTIHLYPTNIIILTKSFSGKVIDNYKVDIMKYLSK